MLNSRHKSTGERFERGDRGDDDAEQGWPWRRWRPGVECATDVTGFGLLGHLLKLARASGVTAVIDAAAVPYLRRGPGGAGRRVRERRNPAQSRLGRPHVDLSGVGDDEALLLADAQTSGGLLLAGEIPGAAVIGELVPRGEHTIVVR